MMQTIQTTKTHNEAKRNKKPLKTNKILFQGGNVLIDQEGKVLYKFIEEENVPWPTIDTIVNEVSPTITIVVFQPENHTYQIYRENEIKKIKRKEVTAKQTITNLLPFQVERHCSTKASKTSKPTPHVNNKVESEVSVGEKATADKDDKKKCCTIL